MPCGVQVGLRLGSGFALWLGSGSGHGVAVAVAALAKASAIVVNCAAHEIHIAAAHMTCRLTDIGSRSNICGAIFHLWTQTLGTFVEWQESD